MRAVIRPRVEISGSSPRATAVGRGRRFHPERTGLSISSGTAALVPGYESDMPAFGDILTPEEIDSVLADIKSTWPRRERQYQVERSSR